MYIVYCNKNNTWNFYNSYSQLGEAVLVMQELTKAGYKVRYDNVNPRTIVNFDYNGNDYE